MRLGTVDLMAAVCVCALAGLSGWDLLRDGTVVGMDTATAFYPWSAYLGQDLRSGHVPVPAHFLQPVPASRSAEEPTLADVLYGTRWDSRPRGGSALTEHASCGASWNDDCP
jgi:hypothetical protein